MWIGTGSGLCRFDGKGFQVMGSRQGLAGDNVFSITEDENGDLWIGCMKGGISRYSGKGFTKYSTKQGLVSENVRVVWFSKKFHLLFIGTNEGCSVFDGKSFVSLSTKETKTDDFYVMGFLEGADFVTIYSYKPVSPYRFYPKTREFIQTKDPYYPSHKASTAPIIMANGDTIIGSNRDGINVLNKAIKRSFKGMGQVFDIACVSRNDYWVAAWSEYPLSKDMPGGLYRFDGNKIARYSEKLGINDPGVWCLYYDTATFVLWVGTLSSGIFQVPLHLFEWYDNNDLGIKELNVRSLFINTDNTLWVGTKGDLFRRNIDGQVKLYNREQIRQESRLERTTLMSFSCIQKDSRGNILTALSEISLLGFSPLDNYADPKFFTRVNGCISFCLDTRDTVFYTGKWMGSVEKVSLYPEISNKTRYDWGVNDCPPDAEKMIASGDTIWYGSRKGGLFWSYHSRFVSFNKSDSTLPGSINDICFDNRGNVIVGSNSGDVLVVRYEKNKMSVKYRLQAGKDFIGNTVKFVAVDNTLHLFIGTNLGLNRIDLQSLYQNNKVIRNFYNADVGYFDKSGKKAVVDLDGNIWVGTDSHLMKIDTKILNRLTPEIPQIKITGMEVNYQFWKNFENQTYFHHDQNNLIFHFGYANYLNPGQTLYRYKLVGLSDYWSDFTTETKSVFTSLNPGKYQLVVESYNTIDNSRVGMVRYAFRIGYPWYMTWWFFAGMIMVLGLSVLWFIRYRTGKIREEEKKKSAFSKQLADIEMKALQSQMNPHFIFNSINSIQGFILKNKVDKALGYLMDFSKILRQTLDNATKEYISLAEEIEYIKYYLNLELMRFDKKFTIDLRIPEELDSQNILIPPMIVQPFVENAIRHGLLHKSDGPGLLIIEFQAEGDQELRCTVEDNGVGRKRSKEMESWKSQTTHKPQSTRITRDRIDLLNTFSPSDKYKVKIIDLYDEKGIGAGTRIEIILPLQIA